MSRSEKTIEIPEEEFLRLVKLEARVESFEEKLNREYKNASMIKKKDVEEALKRILEEDQR